ncbi:hypothetical protein EUGRSUZ_L03278 [Eucalyptus grandis]|uniref:Uncharacterized protein n=1 Tax=Eucalyptus grandis TaxID=71139 RepID=A0AAD9T8F8_EUCGR|nr:hypothetical protein EUGRSUZ_L03278 [Eucalyptus grandis]
MLPLSSKLLKITASFFRVFFFYCCELNTGYSSIFGMALSRMCHAPWFKRMCSRPFKLCSPSESFRCVLVLLKASNRIPFYRYNKVGLSCTLRIDCRV